MVKNIVASIACVASIGLEFASCSPVFAQPADHAQWCEGRANPTFDQRIDACTKIIADNKQTPEKLAWAYGNRGVAYVNNGDIAHARADYEEAIRLDPESASGHRLRGNLLETRREYDNAIVEYRTAIQLNPKDCLAYSNLAKAYYDKGDYDGALGNFSEAVRCDPTWYVAIYGRGLAYRKKGDTDRAIADYDEALSLNPKQPLILTARGDAYISRRDWDRANADYTNALSMPSVLGSQAFAFGGRCRVRFYTFFDLNETLDDCNRALQLKTTNQWITATRGYVYFKLGQFDKAKADFDSAVANYPKWAVALYGRSLAERKSGNANDADKDLELAKTVQPDIAEVIAKEYGIR